MEHPLYKIDALWDPEAAVWVATSEDVPGLATEADTIETLNQKLRDRVPSLLLLNGVINAGCVDAILDEMSDRH